MDYINETHSTFNQFLKEFQEGRVKKVKIQLDENGQPLLDKNGKPIECCGGKGDSTQCSCKGFQSIPLKK